jgi:multicomponent Na+:H+ antiporter subunit G
MAVALDVLSWISILAGCAFCVIGGIGLLRLPDLFTRMHAAGIVDTAGVAFLVVGMVLQAGFSMATIKLLLIVLFVLYTSPVATHALAQAALSMGVRPQLADQAPKDAEREDGPS